MLIFMSQAQKELQEKKGNFFYNAETKYLTIQQGNKKQDMLFNDWKGVVDYFKKPKNLEEIIQLGFDRQFVYNIANFVEMNDKKEASIRINGGIKREINYLQAPEEKTVNKVQKMEVSKTIAKKEEETPGYELIARNYTKNTFEWISKEVENGADLDEIQKYLKQNSKGEYYINKEGIALYRNINSDVRYVKKEKPIKHYELEPMHIVGNVPKNTVTKKDVKKEVTAQKLIEETKKELTLFEKLYGAGDLEFKIKIVGEEMAKRKTDKTKVVEKKEEKVTKKEEKKETTLEKNTREIREMKKAQMEEDSKKVEEGKRKRKGEEVVKKEEKKKEKKEEKEDKFDDTLF